MKKAPKQGENLDYINGRTKHSTMKSIKKETFKRDFVNPLILKILRDSKGPMAALAITYMVNQHFGREVNSSIIKRRLSFLVDAEKISKNSNNANNVTYYKLVV